MMKRLLFSWCVLSLVATSTWAVEPLALSDTQIKKLRAYFPSDDESVPLVWRGEALKIVLPLNAEKRVLFSEPIDANLNGAFASNQLRIINNDQSLYLTALKPFNDTRMYVTLKGSHKILLLDVATSDKASSTAQTIKLTPVNQKSLPSSTAAYPLVTSHIKNASASEDPTREAPFMSTANMYVNTIRFVWQQLYAPKRLLNHSADFVRTPMHTQQWVPDLVYGDKVLARPQVSWISGDLYVTAVELRNKYAHTSTLNLQHDLCGAWQAATLYPRTKLKPAGNKSGDSTTLFLISTQPFGDMLEDCHGSA
jgi:integrating conjugative element protein (TIGR03749 family)